MQQTTTAATHTAQAMGSHDLVDEKDAATALALSVSTLRNWRSLRKGPRFIKVGQRLVRYRRADLEAFIAAGAGGA